MTHIQLTSLPAIARQQSKAKFNQIIVHCFSNFVLIYYFCKAIKFLTSSYFTFAWDLLTTVPSILRLLIEKLWVSLSERPNLYVQPCSLDIGSPLVCDNVLFGIGSNYWNCSNPKEPNMFTSVSKYIKYVAYTQGNAEFSCASNSSISKLFLIFLGIYPKLFCFN